MVDAVLLPGCVEVFLECRQFTLSGAGPLLSAPRAGLQVPLVLQERGRQPLRLLQDVVLASAQIFLFLLEFLCQKAETGGKGRNWQLDGGLKINLREKLLKCDIFG